MVRSVDPSQFRFIDDENGGSGDQGGGRGKRDGRRGRGGNKGGGQSRRRKRRRPNDDSDDQDHSPGASGSEHAEPNLEDTSDLVSTSQELQEDIETAIKTRHFFFVDPDEVATPVQYHTLGWYPGRGAVERKTHAYLAANPQIRAHIDQMLPDDYDSEMEDMFVSKSDV
ncbi:hypothetical protein APHAL10511_000514 [Amanita phalloides]|nr:hypothetical protein APHAL10511_000514 [Amanita phalloides]